MATIDTPIVFGNQKLPPLIRPLMTKKNEFMIFFTPEIDSKHNN